MVEQEHSYRGEKSAYFINPLHYRFKDIFYFQISGSEAINITSTDLILALSDNELNFTKIREILDRLNFTEKTFEILLQKKIIIPAELYPKTIITILEQFEQNLYTSDYSNSINSIFPYSESYSYRIVSVIKAALSLNKTFVLDRISDSGMCVKFKNGYVYNIISENCFNEDPVSIQITKSKSLSSFLLRSHMINVPAQCVLSPKDKEVAFNMAKKIGYPLCIKPDDRAESIDVFPQIYTETELLTVLEYVSKKYDKIILEKHIVGKVYRLYYCFGMLNLAIEKRRKYVIGDGCSTVSKLATQKYGATDLHKYHMDFLLSLAQQNVQPITILPHGCQINISNTANENDFTITHLINKEFFTWVERIAGIIGMNAFAIDIISDSLSMFNNPAVLEIQECPEFHCDNPIADVFYIELIKNLTSPF